MKTAKQFKCHICSQNKSQGIWLVQGYICASCLKEISKTEVGDPRYRDFVAKLRELWQTG